MRTHSQHRKKRNRCNVLVVDDEEDMIYTCSRVLEELPMKISSASNGEEALRLIAHIEFDVALLDIVMPEMSGVDLLRKIKQSAPETEVIMLTGFPTVDTAVEAVREGALDYLTKPFSPEQLQISVEKALAVRKLKRENLRLRAFAKKHASTTPIIGSSPALKASLDLIEKAAGDSYCNVLITGKTGTGKELTARAIHAQSDRQDMPFVPVDCGAMVETLLGSELFGHEKGAFTGADEQRIGILEYANGGTVFLDEISEMSNRLQVALLRFLQERQFRPVGSNQYIDTDVRIIGATNADLAGLVRMGSFREDLYFRLNVFHIHLPPLRERNGDIPRLVETFVEQLATQRGKSCPSIDSGVMRALSAYQWPGNIRELQNVVERAVLLCDSDKITLDLLPDSLRSNDDVPAQAQSDFRRAKSTVITQFESTYLTDVLKNTEGNVRRAAQVAGMPRSSLQRLLKKHRIDAQSFTGQSLERKVETERSGG